MQEPLLYFCRFYNEKESKLNPLVEVEPVKVEADSIIVLDAVHYEARTSCRRLE
eukprot:c13533_g1_i3 orf=525-686(+)